MGVQVRITDTVVEVVEPCDQQPLGLDLAGAAGPATGVDHLVLDPGEGLVDGLLMCLFDSLFHLGVAETPQQRDRLHRREHQVVPGHRLAHLRVLLGDELGDILVAHQVDLVALGAPQMLAGGGLLDRSPRSGIGYSP